MVFKDKFPLQLEFDIDRDKLARYYRLQAILAVPPVHVDGLMDVDSFRDELCEIDSAREST